MYPAGVDERLTVADAAALLGITEGAVRKRCARGTLAHERDEGRVWVLLPPGTRRGAAGQDAGQPGGQDTGQRQQDAEQLVEELRDRIRYLERQLDVRTEELREHRRLIAGFIERVPEQLEAARPADARRVAPRSPQEPPGGPERAPGGQDAGQDGTARQEGTRRSPWWRRWLGG